MERENKSAVRGHPPLLPPTPGQDPEDMLRAAMEVEPPEDGDWDDMKKRKSKLRKK